MSDLTDAKRRLVERLKRVDSATAGELAAEFELTDVALAAVKLVHEASGATDDDEEIPDLGQRADRDRPGA